MSEGVIKMAIICFTIICCFGFMTRAMIKMDESIKKEDEHTGDKVSDQYKLYTCRCRR